MVKTFMVAAALAAVAGCAANGGRSNGADLQSAKPVLFLSIRSADQVFACFKPTVDHWGSVADVVSHPAQKRVDVTVYEDHFPQRQDYYLVRIEPTPGGSATRFFSNGRDHPRVPAEKVEDVLRGCTT